MKQALRDIAVVVLIAGSLSFSMFQVGSAYGYDKAATEYESLLKKSDDIVQAASRAVQAARDAVNDAYRLCQPTEQPEGRKSL